MYKITKTVIILLILNCQFSAVYCQLKIDDCYAKAEANYPLVKQYALIEKSKNFSVENAQKAYLPQFGIYGQATYQSDVTQIPFDFSNVPIPGLSDVKMPKLTKDQYKVYGEVSYSLTDLITNKNQTNLVKANAEIETQKIEVELYKLRERIDKYHTDDWGAYSKYIPADRHRIGKDRTWKIERKNLNFRTHLKRLNRKTICFSKNEIVHDNVIGMYIENFYYKTGT